MDAPGRGGNGTQRDNPAPTSGRSRASRMAVPTATLALTVALEFIEAPVLSLLAALRLVEALRELSHDD